MNKTEFIVLVSKKSGVHLEDCTKVLDAFEEVFGKELSEKGWKNGVFNVLYQVLDGIKNKKKNKQSINL